MVKNNNVNVFKNKMNPFFRLKTKKSTIKRMKIVKLVKKSHWKC